MCLRPVWCGVWIATFETLPTQSAQLQETCLWMVPQLVIPARHTFPQGICRLTLCWRMLETFFLHYMKIFLFGNKATWAQVMTLTSNVRCKQSQHVFPFFEGVEQWGRRFKYQGLGAIMQSWHDLSQLLSPPARWSETNWDHESEITNRTSQFLKHHN